jgi:hypothetical protein
MLRSIVRRAAALSAGLAGAIVLSACTGGRPVRPAAAEPVQAAWVELGDGGQTIARVITTDAACPSLSVDGATVPMALRAAAATAPLRKTAGAEFAAKPASFPVAVCELVLPGSVRQAAVGGRVLPLPKAEPQRIAIIGDTGCRMKAKGGVFQSCNDPAVWPFATIVSSVAKLSPDLVLHVGDYNYRENACPPDNAGCQGSPWGYGWDTWQAELFRPAAPLLAQAPWVFVRGNHEECSRAGQGWFRFLDPWPYAAMRSCDDPANDGEANYSEPYAVPLGAGSQFVVFDTAKLGSSALDPAGAPYRIYRRQFRRVAALAGKANTATIFTSHHPALAFAATKSDEPDAGNPALLSVLSSLNGQAYFPPGVQLALHGHVHAFQAIDFASGQAATIVSGNSGDKLEPQLPDPFPAELSPAPGVAVAHITHRDGFGFMLMERHRAPAAGWTFKAYTAEGRLLLTCEQEGKRLACDKTGHLAP